MGIEQLKIIQKEMDRREISYDTDKKVIISNHFILHSMSNLTCNEFKLLSLIITQCKLDDNKLYTFRVKSKDLAKLLEVDSNDIRRDLRKMTRHIMQEVLEIENPKKGEFLQFHWTDECEYKSGIVTIKIADKLAPYLLHLKRDFSQIPLGELLPFKSRYTMNIYQALIANIGRQGDNPHADEYSIVNISMDALRVITNTKNKYPRFNNFNARILIPSVKEINKVSKYHVTATPYRTSHSVSGVEFMIESQAGYIHRTEDKPNNKIEIVNDELPDGQMNIFDYQTDENKFEIKDHRNQ